jgi:UPF0755 protein
LRRADIPPVSRVVLVGGGFALLLMAAACARSGGEEVEIRVPDGAGASAIASTLADSGLVRHPRFFALYAGLRGSEARLKAGRYRFPADATWAEMLDAMERGRVETRAITIPEGFTTRELAPRLAEITTAPADSILALARDTAFARELGVPGPTLEGYLFPETYRFAEGVSPRRALGAMVQRYREFWTPERRERARELGLDEREVVTLASIVEEEARVPEERSVIAGVYHNRLERGMLLQADPTVQFALDTTKARLLFRDIDDVADNPYNTYTQPGLPPGPIASPGEGSLRAVLEPADVPYLFFVARPDGSHVFTETNAAHEAAIAEIRGGGGGSGGSSSDDGR